MQYLSLGEIDVEVVQKSIKNIHLSVYPPVGRVRVAAPTGMELDTIRIYVISKLPWIRQQQKKFLGQEREAPRAYVNRESHYFLGKRYLLKVVAHDAAPLFRVKQSSIEMFVRPSLDQDKRHAAMDEWYRSELKALIPPLIEKWEKIMGVSVASFGIKRMKTKWGTCSIASRRIWLNLELAKKPFACIEYIVVHEMVHLLERNHTARFVALMDGFLPEWREVRVELNRLPVGHWDWGY